MTTEKPQSPLRCCTWKIQRYLFIVKLSQSLATHTTSISLTWNTLTQTEWTFSAFLAYTHISFYIFLSNSISMFRMVGKTMRKCVRAIVKYLVIGSWQPLLYGDFLMMHSIRAVLCGFFRDQQSISQRKQHNLERTKRHS